MSDRKYRQRGYRDDDRERPRPRESSVGDRDGPRGRGLGGPGRSEFRCSVCNRVHPGDAIAFDATCEGCGAALHTCRNCRYFDASAPNECTEAVEVRVPRKTEANECDRFEPKRIQSIGAKDDPSDAKSAFDALFDL